MKELWQQAVKGDKEAENEIFRRLRERFTVIAGLSMCKEDAGDLAHDACLTVLKGYKDLKSPFEYNAWAQKVFKSKVADYFGRKSRDRNVFVGLEDFEAMLACSKAGQDFETMETLRRCLKMLAEKYPRYAKAIHLKHYGYETERICGKMKTSKNNFYVLLTRGRAFLKDCILGGATTE